MNAEIHKSESQRSSIVPGAGELNSRKAVIALSVLMALQMTSFSLIVPLLARRFSELGAGVRDLGISDMMFALAGALAAPLMGTLADRFGRRPLIMGSLAAYVMAYCGFIFAPLVGVLILIRGVAGAF